ncbi:MAG: UDP-N-acetylmuramoyl-L-alanine--D-glutamate ligase [Desulfopila sp.]
MQHSGRIHHGMCVAVVGLGVTGRAAVRYCQKLGAKVVVSDSRGPERFRAESADFLDQTGVEWEAGGHTMPFLQQADCIVVSPGVPQNHPVIVGLQAQGKTVVGELAVVAPLLEMPVVAVTGTNGKTTVTSLIGEIVRCAGRRVFVGGNIGTPVFDLLDQGDLPEVVVLEVSSFQLLLAGAFRPDIGVLLNITPDHLNRHGSLADYAEAKMRLFHNQRQSDSAILSADDPECARHRGEVTGRCLTFGGAADCTARIDGTKIWTGDDCGTFCYDLAGTAMANGIGVGNAAAAILACRTLGIAPEVILRAIAAFRPGPHRIEEVGELAGIRFVNDSKATNTGAVIAALAQLQGKAVLIAGGQDKGDDFRLLRPLVQQKVKEAILLGAAGEQLAEALRGTTTLHTAPTLEDAVRLGYRLASPGDTVLLSPACASFDMFESYGHRGTVFRQAVLRLIADETVATEVDDEPRS